MAEAIISDIHGNAIALDACLQDFDALAKNQGVNVRRVTVNGDMVNRGAQPVQTLDRLMYEDKFSDREYRFVPGNHEYMLNTLLEGRDVPETAGVSRKVIGSVYVHRELLFPDCFENGKLDINKMSDKQRQRLWFWRRIVGCEDCTEIMLPDSSSWVDDERKPVLYETQGDTAVIMFHSDPWFELDEYVLDKKQEALNEYPNYRQAKEAVSRICDIVEANGDARHVVAVKSHTHIASAESYSCRGKEVTFFDTGTVGSPRLSSTVPGWDDMKGHGTYLLRLDDDDPDVHPNGLRWVLRRFPYDWRAAAQKIVERNAETNVYFKHKGKVQQARLSLPSLWRDYDKR